MIVWMKLGMYKMFLIGLDDLLNVNSHAYNSIFSPWGPPV